MLRVVEGRSFAIAAVLLIGPRGTPNEPAATIGYLATSNRVRPASVIDITTAERWMHGRQVASFTPLNRSTRSVVIDGEKDGGSESRVRMHFADPVLQRVDAIVSLDSHRRVVAVAVSTPARRTTTYPMFTAHEESVNRFLDGDAVALPASRVWDVLPALSPARMPAHGSWRDTIDLHASEGKFSQRLSGIRVSTIIGDTLVGGRLYPIIRDSAAVSYWERGERQERTLDTFVVVERRARGSIIGRYLLDSTNGAFHVRDDTTRLAGAASLKYPEGRSFTTQATFERTRHIATLSKTGYDSLSAERHSHQEQFSIIERPVGIAERISAGDARLEDSVIAALSSSRNAEKRAEIQGLIERWSRKLDARKRIEAEAFSSGDLTFAFPIANEKWRDGREPIDLPTMRELLRVLSDPGFAFSLGIDPDVYYEHANDALLTHPLGVNPDTTKWPCTRDACGLLVAQSSLTTEPRLRALALVARLTMEPAGMCDSAFAHGENVPALTGLQTLAIATVHGRCGPQSGALPVRNAEWREWLGWTRRTQRWTNNPRVPFGDSRLKCDPLSLIRMAERASGRSLESEWRLSFARAGSDSARTVYATLLDMMGEVGESAEQIASRLQSASGADRQLGASEMIALFLGHSHPADTIVAADVIGTLLATSLDGGRSWPPLFASEARDSARISPHRVAQALDGAYGPQEKPISEPIILFRDDIPSSVLATMRRRGVQIVDSGFALSSAASALILTIRTPQVVGPFLMVTLTHEHEAARVAGRGQSWASGSTYYLLRTESGWKIVTSSTWIT